MSLSKFTPDELMVWIDAELETLQPKSYQLRDGELTVSSYLELSQSSEHQLSREGARDRLNRLARAGRLTKRREKIDGRSVNIYARVEDR